MKKPKLSIVLPCYNELRNIPLNLKRIADVIDGTPIELILVNNGSTDDSEKVLNRELKNPKYRFARSIHIKKNRGYGYGILTGLKSASGEYISYSHADLQTDPRDIIRGFNNLLKFKNPKKVLMKGKRLKREPVDWFFAASFQLIADILFLKRFNDINGQPKIFHRDFLSLLANPPSDANFDIYLQYIALKNNMKVESIPVILAKRLHGHSSWNFNFYSRLKLTKIYFIYLIKLRIFGNNILKI